MKRVVKQVAGIDVAQKELVVSLGRIDEDQKEEIYGFKTFSNTAKGFESLVMWVEKKSEPSMAVHYVMEATGVYHEGLAYYLEGKGYVLSVVLPNKISNYHRTLEVKSVTDKTASETIARFGLGRRLDCWKRPNGVFKQLRQLTRERDQLVKSRTQAQNQLHAEQTEAEPNKGTVSRLKKQLVFLKQQMQEIEEELSLLVKGNDQLQQSVKRICSLPGVGLLTALTVLGESNGFDLIRNKRQLVSYAGLDVREKQSGTSVKSKPRISKKGNRYLRKAMHMPSLTAIRNDERFKAIFARLVAKHGIKMKAVVAVQRKLLEMIYIIYKNNTMYNKDYLIGNQSEEVQSLKN
jgi:transposase